MKKRTVLQKHWPVWCATLAVCLTTATVTNAAVTGHWVWTESQSAENERAWFRKEFSLDESLLKNVKAARLYIACDNHAIVFLNGQQVGRNDEWAKPKVVSVEKHLQPKKNLLAVDAWNDSGPAGLLVCLEITLNDKKLVTIATDKAWQWTRQRVEVQRIADPSYKFQPVAVIAELGKGAWGNVFASAEASVVGSTFSAGQPTGPVLLDDQFVLPAGFHIYRAATRELSGGSYAMAIDDQGRLLVGDGSAIRRLAGRLSSKAGRRRVCCCRPCGTNRSRCRRRGNYLTL